MQNMGFGYKYTEKIMYMCRKALETHFVTHEAMYVDEEQSPTTIPRRL